MAALQQIDRAAREGRVDSPARAQAICPDRRTPPLWPGACEPGPAHRRSGKPNRTPCTSALAILARGRSGFRTEPHAPVRGRFRLAGRGWRLVGRAAGEAALISSHRAHPICPIAGSFSPGPVSADMPRTCTEIEPHAPVRWRSRPVDRAWRRVGRDLARRGIRRRIEPHTPVGAGRFGVAGPER
jgi:hypothetical protein